MARPKYHIDSSGSDIDLYSPLGEKIISTYATMGAGDEIRYIDHVDLNLPDDKIGNSHDKLFKFAMEAHQRKTTTRWQRFQWSVEEFFSHPFWAVIAAVAATIAAVGAFGDT